MAEPITIHSPKVSIITCFLNVEAFIEDTIKSVLSQQYHNWELILFDDGSIDNSSNIARGYAETNPGRIIYKEHDAHVNKGLSASRNVAITKASGDLITFLDADDIWLPEYLQHQIDLFNILDVAMICEATKYWYSWKQSQSLDDILEIGTVQDTTYLPPQLIKNLYPLGTGAAPCVCGIIIKKDVLVKYGGFDDAFTGMYEDQVFLSKIYLNEKIYISSACNNLYRQRPESLVGSSSNDHKYYEVRRKFLHWLKNYMANNNIQYPDVDDLLNKALHQPLVSVVIAFYNEEKFLKETVESVINQHYTNWELLLVDDGSSDNSTAFAKHYSAKDDRIKYCEHSGHINKGLSASRNEGIKNSTGELVAFLDADDVWLPDKLVNQVSIFERNPEIGMSAEASMYWHSWHQTTSTDITLQVGTSPEEVYDPPLLLYTLYPLGKGAAPVPSGLMLTRKAIDEVGGFEETFRKQYSLYEDQAFLSKIYLTQKVYISSRSNNLYRQRPGSIVKWVKADGQYDNVRKYFLEWFLLYINRNNIDDHQLQTLLDEALLPYHKPLEFWWTKTLPKNFKKVVRKVLQR